MHCLQQSKTKKVWPRQACVTETGVGRRYLTVIPPRIAWAATAVILFSATYLYKILGRPVLIAIERLMGMLLVAISVQMLMDGIATYLRVPAVAG